MDHGKRDQYKGHNYVKTSQMEVNHIKSHGQSHSRRMEKVGPSTERYCDIT